MAFLEKQEICRLLHSGARDRVMKICCALHLFGLGLIPGFPIPESEESLLFFPTRGEKQHRRTKRTLNQ